MPTEAWRLALARWGDPAWTLAVLLTGRPDAAQSLVVDVFCASYHAEAPADPEHALYHALVRHRVRLDQARRRPLLTPALRRVAPIDRLLLGLWLLREQNGEQLASLTGETLEALTARLTTAVLIWGSTRHIAAQNLSQAELSQLITQHLALPPGSSISTRTGVYGTQSTIVDQLQNELRELTHAMHLPPECPALIEIRLEQLQQANAVQWWQRKAFWQLGLVVLTLVVLAMLMLPRRTVDPQHTVTTSTAQSLVQHALQQWSMTTSHITHRRVWAIDPQRQRAGAVVTDVWLAAGDSTEHRVEVRRGKRLLEWQIADGGRRLNYGAIPSESTCSWHLARTGNAQAAVSFRISSEEQRIVRDARLKQGAYGLGYLALQRALAAPDLRSYGTRVIDSRTFTTLIYSDTYWGPSQQVVLRIEPASGELYGVQTVSTAGTQTRTRDLWRVDTLEDTEFIPSPLPEWNEAKRATHVLDPTCLMLLPADVHDLRSILNTPDTQWYLPQALPAGINRAAIVTPPPPSSPDDVPVPESAQFAGPGRFLSISPVSWQPNIAGPDDIERGPWRIAIEPQGGRAPTHLTLHLRPEHNAGVFPQLGANPSGWSVEQTLDSFVATIDVTAQGWIEEDLLNLVDQLEPASPATWKLMRDHFVTPQPPDDAVRTALDQSIEALQAPAQGTIVTSAQSRFRTRTALPDLSDPYHLANELWAPRVIQQRQTLVYGASGIERFVDQRTTDNATPYVHRSSDGTRFVFDNHAQGWAIEGDAGQLGVAAYPEQPGMKMLATLLGGSEPITITEQTGAWILERTAHVTQEALNGDVQGVWSDTPWTANLPQGDITYRLWLDRVTSLPQRIEIVHRAENDRVLLQETVITERRVVEPGGANAQLTFPTIPGDDLRFNWVPGSGPVIGNLAALGTTGPALTWNAESSVAMQWQLEPATTVEQLSMSAFKAPRWFNLSRLSTVHRTLYRIDSDNFMGVMVTQGPKDLMKHVIRYSEMSRGADAMPWTTSTRMIVTINGSEHEAWLLAENEVAALVVDFDDRLVHIMGLRSYLEGPLIPMLAQLTTTP